MTKQFSLETFLRQYETDTSELVIKNRRFQFFVPKSLEKFLDADDMFHDFPLWAKIWEASIVLSNHLSTLPVDPEKRILEIGCGLGVVGATAAAFGHRITLTEYHPDALNFARANVCANLPSNHAPTPEIRRLDWNSPRVKGPYDVIVGSEVIYKETDFQPILRLFDNYLHSSGKIILAEGVRKTSMEFFNQMSDRFDISARKMTLRSKGGAFPVILAEMRLKSTPSGRTMH